MLSIVLADASDAVRVLAFDRDVAAYPDGERTWGSSGWTTSCSPTPSSARR